MVKKIIAFQGSVGANSHLACKKFYPEYNTKAFASFSDVFKAVENCEVEYGMIPLENSSAGRISEIHNLLQKHQLYIVAEHFVEIKHNLAGIKGSKIEDIKQVFSHPQALMQCYNNLQSMNIKSCDFSNTAEAAKFISSENDITKAALCSTEAAEINGLNILKSDMQDMKNNATIFVTISREMLDADPKKASVISLIFTIKNYPGSLYKALGSFATNDVSMIQIESFIRNGLKRPGGVSENAAFFVTIEGHPSQKKITVALQELEFFAKKIKLLGIYYADESRFKKS
jgi:prephenate dehydratase